MKRIKIVPVNFESIKNLTIKEIPSIPDFENYLRILSHQSLIHIGFKKIKQLNLKKWVIFLYECIKKIPRLPFNFIGIVTYLFIYYEILTLKFKPRKIIINEKFFDMFILIGRGGVFKIINNELKKKKIYTLFATKNVKFITTKYPIEYMQLKKSNILIMKRPCK